ncbi:Z1 domain-containing protein [Caldimonas tepidiphila]|uniref:Z1 domain-containing protein n=1 Tax=Caldimonas tepidiphila TaxID=2315841 RepID=UPI000E5BFBA6|nr:Z1 domain-containing protein [Caldimonas tepidiphila]
MSYDKVVKFAQELLQDEEDKAQVTPALIETLIDRVLQINRRWADGLDRQAVTDELIRRNSQWIGQDTTLTDSTDHEAWLDPARKRNWRYWQRYREWLERRMSLNAVDALDRTTDNILGMLEDPQRKGPWGRRGLVVGHVQSGKTSNYTALIGKAADAGYKIIIVLAGLHNNLRAQTQIRLDEGFLGYETRPLVHDLKITGVGEIDGDAAIRPNFATNRTEKGDFNATTARTLGISPEQRPWLFVVKKNKTVLERLYQWIRNHVADAQDGRRKIVTHLPLLLIDDESDHASVDTGEQWFDENGKPDEEHQPTAINSRIRKILHSFSRSAYVGYTATPFANIFIHERGETAEEGPDLFPSAFITNLGAPSNYVGPARVFGKPGPSGREGSLPLIREVEDHVSADGKHGWMPAGHKSTHRPQCEGEANMPASLVEAIDAFILACAVRQLRGHGREHSSMLIHVTRFNAVQEIVHQHVETHVGRIRQRLDRGIGHEDHLGRLRALWEADTCPTALDIQEALGDDARARVPDWSEVASVLPEVLSSIDVRMINGTAKDALDYAENAEIGLKVIAIGGDKLARGLTLEGLCVSYFLRASRMYDTLMQMGRWFGYRPGYLDLCRLYTTEELNRWFGLITDASEELREEFEIMARNKSTPREYGLRVKAHPGLMVTSRVKMRAAKSLMLSFSGHISETITFFNDRPTLQANLDALDNLLVGLGSPETDPVRPWDKDGPGRWKGRYLWRHATADDVLAFLGSYRTHPEAHKANAAMLAEFIQGMTTEGELTEWSVALVGAESLEYEHQLKCGLRVAKLRRKNERSEGSAYSIGRLLSPPDEAIDVDRETWEAALTLTRESWHADPGRADKAGQEPDFPSGVALRRVRGHGAPGVPPSPQRGLLLLYLLDPERSGVPNGKNLPPVVGFGISFPGSNSGRKVEYKVNNVGWELDYAD